MGKRKVRENNFYQHIACFDSLSFFWISVLMSNVTRPRSFRSLSSVKSGTFFLRTNPFFLSSRVRFDAHTTTRRSASSTDDMLSFMSVDRKHRNVSVARTVRQNAKTAFARERTVFIVHGHTG